MIRFILRRLIIIPPALLIVHFFGFAYAYTADPRTVAGVESPTAAMMSAYRGYLQNALKLDFGLLPNGQPLQETIVRSSQASLGLLGIAIVLSVSIGLLLGFWAARTDPARVARWMTPVSTMGLAMPSFYLGSVFIVGSIYYAIWGGPGVRSPFPLQGFGWDLHLVMPVVVLMFRPMVQITQVTAELLVAEFNKQYVVAARSLGHTWRSIRNRQALRNALPPIIVTITNSFRLLIGELILVEFLFAWPGLGRMMAKTLVPPRLVGAIGSTPSTLFLHPTLLAALVTVFAAIFLTGDFIAAFTARVIDPRLRRLEEEAGNV